MSRTHRITAAPRGRAVVLPGVLAALIGLAAPLGLGCRQAADFSAYREEAVALAERVGPELEGLARRVPALVRRAGQLPSTAPGMAELQAQLAENRAEVSRLESAIRGLPGKIGSAIKTRKVSAVERTLAVATSEIEDALVILRAELDATASDVARLEAAVRAAAR